MTVTIHDTVALTTMECGSCGILFAIPETYREERQVNGGSWYCPNGHSRVYRKTDLQKAREERDEALRKLSQKSCELLSERDEREKIEKKLNTERKRTKNGVCPCCHRSFQNIKRHIKTKHPSFAP